MKITPRISSLVYTLTMLIFLEYQTKHLAIACSPLCQWIGWSEPEPCTDSNRQNVSRTICCPKHVTTLETCVKECNLSMDSARKSQNCKYIPPTSAIELTTAKEATLFENIFTTVFETWASESMVMTTHAHTEDIRATMSSLNSDLSTTEGSIDHEVTTVGMPKLLRFQDYIYRQRYNPRDIINAVYNWNRHNN